VSFLAAKRRLLILVALVGSAMSANEPFKEPFLYTVVNCCDSHGLTVFPFNGKAFTIPLPFVPRLVAFSPKGNAVYAIKPRGVDRQNVSAIVKIEFHPTRVNRVWESLDLEISSFAVSMREDKLVIAGRPRNRAERTCGLFEISLPGEKVRRILESSDCRNGAPWDEISLSPDGERAVAADGRDLELIDLANGTVKSLGSEFSTGTLRAGASWSPDGKRIAVMESANAGRVFLLEPSDLSRQRALHSGYHQMTPVWSPDSRYLVRSRLQLRCGISFDEDPPFTLEIVDVESGKRALIRGSSCKMEGGSTGWLSTDLVR
jgi:DNA-binding beta-propeller fold protein YncE